MNNLLDEQRHIVAYLDELQVKVNAFPLAAKRLGDDLREPHKGVILQVKGGEGLRPFVGRTLTSSPCGIASVLDRAFKGELL